MGGPQYRPQDIIILTIRAPKRVPQILGKLPDDVWYLPDLLDDGCISWSSRVFEGFPKLGVPFWGLPVYGNYHLMHGQ